MQDPNNVTDLFECPVCGYTAETQEELNDHFQEKSDDEEHQEYNPGKKEIIDEDSIGAPAGTPGHPGIDEGTD